MFYLLVTKVLFQRNGACISLKQRLCFTSIEALFCSSHVPMSFSPQIATLSPCAIHFCPRTESIYFACWAYRFSIVSIYAYYAEYIDLSASLKALNALSLGYSLFLQGMIFFAFSRYLLPVRRLQTKLKRLKQSYYPSCQLGFCINDSGLGIRLVF